MHIFNIDQLKSMKLKEKYLFFILFLGVVCLQAFLSLRAAFKHFQQRPLEGAASRFPTNQLGQLDLVLKPEVWTVQKINYNFDELKCCIFSWFFLLDAQSSSSIFSPLFAALCQALLGTGQELVWAESTTCDGVCVAVRSPT